MKIYFDRITHNILITLLSFTFAEIAAANEEKFRKMKDIYMKLREEHVTLIRSVRQSSYKNTFKTPFVSPSAFR